MNKVKFFNSRTGRALVLSMAIMFIASAFFINPDSARMQSGANTIAFDRDDENGDSKVFVMNADGTNVTELANGIDPTYSPDGTKIAYVVGNGETSNIWVMNADGSNQARLTETYQAFAPAWSPDGTKVAFVSSHQNGFQVYVINADGTNQQKLEVGNTSIYYKFSPAFSPDGTKIYIVGYAQTGNGTAENLYAVNADNSGGFVQLTFAASLINSDTLAVAPDGQTIVARYQHDLRAIATNGSGTITNLTNGNTQIDRHPAFAPNGAKIVFQRDDYLYVMNADGSNAVSLDVVGDNPSWNPTAVLPPPPTPTPTMTPTPTPTPAVEADLSVNVVASANEVAINGTLTYTITVTNHGTAAATNVKLHELLSQSVAYSNVQWSQGACLVGNNPMTCELGNLAPNAQATVTVQAIHNQGGTATNTVSVEATEADPNMDNNTKTISVNVLANCAQPLSIPYEITHAQWRRDNRRGQDELVLTVRNRSSQSVDPRLMFVFDNLPQGITIDPSVVGGYTQCAPPLNSPYVVAYAPNKREWKPMQTISVRVLFNGNQSNAGISYDLRLYSGTGNP